MTQHEKHLYMIVHPTNALVASMLDPRRFAEHYTVGSTKHYEGKVIFAELDPEFRSERFEIEHYLELTAPVGGEPKKTKYVASYAVLEHVPLKAMRSLYLVTADGHSLELKSAPYTAFNEPGLVRLYQEIAPLTNLVASTLDQRAFGSWITTGTRSKGAPKVCFTQYDFDVARFLEEGARMLTPIPGTHPSRLYDYLRELKKHPEKKTKTISLNPTLHMAPFGLIRHGFWFAAAGETRFYPMPSKEALERDHYDWWRYAR